MRIPTYSFSFIVAMVIALTNISSVFGMQEEWSKTGENTPPATPEKINSKTCSPCDKTPQKKGGPTGERATRAPRSLDFNVYQDSPIPQKPFEAALQETRRNRDGAGSNESPLPPYLCALLSPESGSKIDESLTRLLKEKIESTTIDRIMDSREAGTILDFSPSSKGQKRFHMSLVLPEPKPSDEDLARLQGIIPFVEFEFSHLECMKRFIAIRLREPTVKNEAVGVSQEDMKFLRRFLQYNGADPVMHISLIMVNSSREEMECIPPQQPEILLPIPDTHIDVAIKSAENMIKGFNSRDFKQTISRLYLSYLFEVCKDTRTYISEVPSGNKEHLYPYLYMQATIFLESMPSLPDITQVYFRKAFNADFNFTGKLCLQYHETVTKEFTSEVINSLFSKLLLSSDTVPFDSFHYFKQSVSTFIKEKWIKIKERELEIVSGRTNLESDNFDPFESNQEELTFEEKEIHEKQNFLDRLEIVKVERELSMLFVMRFLFGLPFHQTAFDHFQENPDSLSLGEALTMLTKENPLHPDFNVANVLHFPTFLDTAIQLGDGVEPEIKDTVTQAKESLESAKGSACKSVTFSSSQISNTIFWHKFWHLIEKRLSQMLQGQMFSFSEISSRALIEEQ